MNLNQNTPNRQRFGNSPQHVLQGILINHFNEGFESSNNIEVAAEQAAMECATTKTNWSEFNFSKNQFDYLCDIASKAVIARAKMHGDSEEEVLKLFTKFVNIIDQKNIFDKPN
mgnify:CR=1 FL=1